MSLRLWTATLALAGLALYTWSLLPASGSQPLEVGGSEPDPAQAAMPGASVVPLNFVDPSELEFLPEDDSCDGPHYETDSLTPFIEPVHEPKPSRPVASAAAFPIHSRSSLEVLS